MRKACEIGLQVKRLENRSWQDLLNLGRAFPQMVRLNNGNCVIVVGVAPGEGGVPHLLVLDPLTEQAGILLLSQQQFCTAWGGTLILLKRAYALTDENQPFGLRWFLPELLKHRRLLRDIGLAALMMHLIAFSTPLLFQIIIDKVITHHATQTLLVVVGAFLVAVLFEAIFSLGRQYLLLFVTNKVDARLAARVFAHLVSLPMQFFERTTAGVLAKHLQQTEKVRQFLTGRLFQTLLDAAALPVLIVVLLFYSAKLTAVVLGFSLVIAMLIAVLVPTFRQRLQELYRAEGERQAHLVETVHGMRTVKSLALEPVRRRTWEARIAQSITQQASVGRMSAWANVMTHATERLMLVAVIGLGATDVFDGSLSVGALVAFQMLSGRVTGPLVQIVSLINEYQEAALSVAMLGQVMNHPPERKPGAGGVRPPLTGAVEFDNITFTYPGSAVPALDRVSFKIAKGQMIGVVGRSGSGKTTLTRLVQGIDTAQQGLVRFDGVDIRQMDLNHLRRSIGVVLQDNFLFRGTVRENIAAAVPDAPLTQVIEAARLAGAEEFIDRLPMSYDTMIEENGSNFSGGQRQRLAIARALLTRPKLLIFDEATSALDPESEAIVQKNLGAIAQGRTTIIVSHRLSSLMGADSIIVLEQGRVIDVAPHAVLLERCAVYRHLWQQQTHYAR
ncbi:MAG TPA: peptidase domain-containing ABC transporter [Magnetospirillum sp.]|nr:peptidase domain-containing ABC transporter [Magnetospirillum sp.]